MHYFVPCPKQGKYFRIFFVLNRVRISNPQQLTYSQIWLSPPPPPPPPPHPKKSWGPPPPPPTPLPPVFQSRLRALFRASAWGQWILLSG